MNKDKIAEIATIHGIALAFEYGINDEECINACKKAITEALTQDAQGESGKDEVEFAKQQMTAYVDMGHFAEPDTALPYLIDGFLLGYRTAKNSTPQPDRFEELVQAIDEHTYERGFAPMMCPTDDKVVWVADINRIIKEVKEIKPNGNTKS